jgi:hypothetical protein
MADKLWAEKTPLDLVAIVQRQVMFSEHLNERGIPTSAIVGRYCEKFASHCFSRYDPPASLGKQALLFNLKGADLFESEEAKVAFE